MRVFDSLRVFILRLDGAIDSLTIPPVVLTETSTLEDIRQVFVTGPLGTTDHDIFFPTWTRSIHVIKESDDIDHATLTHEQVHSIKYDVGTTEELQDMLDQENKSPGTHLIVLQQCRSKRYSRKTIDMTTDSNPGTGTSVATSYEDDSKFSEKDHQNRSAGFSLSMKASHHHHHNHHHHYQPNSHNVNEIPPFSHISQSSTHHHLIKSLPKRNNFRPVDPTFSYTTIVPPPLTPTFIATHSIPPQNTCPHSSFDAPEQTILFYPEPILSYGLIPQGHIPPPPPPPPPPLPAPHMVPQIYAVPWNSTSFNYLPAGSVPTTWFMA